MKKLTLFCLLAFFAGVTLNAATQYCQTDVKSTIDNTTPTIKVSVY